MQKVLQSYLKRLTNLSANNRSICLLRLISDQFIDIHDFDFLLKRPSFGIIEDLIANKSEIPLCKVMDSRDEDTNKVSRRLKKLMRIEKFIFDERGSKDLYVGWPFLRGKLSDGSLVRCPLMFFPAALENDGKHWKLLLRKDVNITLNKTFLLAYSYFNNVSIEDELVERVFDDFNHDSRIFRTSLYELLKDSPVEINFNQDNFIDKLHPFSNYRKAEFEQLNKEGKLKLHPEAALGIFPQAGSHLVPDYLDLIENHNFQDIEEFFAEKTIIDQAESAAFRANNFTYLTRIKEEQTFTPFKMDAYQENALKAIKRGISLVVQGPPGTGKSQLICNIICDFIARGKKVLVVSQKRAALDVVYNRLKEKSISDFIGLVHDIKNDRKEVYEKIADQVDRVDEYKQKNNSLDSIQLERSFAHASRRIDQITEELEEFKQALYDESECGKSIKELYLTSDVDAPAIDLRLLYKHFRYDDTGNFEKKLQSYARYAAKFQKPDYPWYRRKPFTGYGVSELKRLKQILEEIPEYQDKIREEVSGVISPDLTLDAYGYYLSQEDSLKKLMGLLEQDGTNYSYFRHMTNYPDSKTNSLWLTNIERVVMDCYKREGVEESLSSDQLGQFQKVLEKALNARRGLIKYLRWKLFSKDKNLIKQVAAANKVDVNRKGLKRLVKKIDNRLNLEHNFTKLKDTPWIKDIPKNYRKDTVQRWFACWRAALEAKLIFTSIRNLREFFNIQKIEQHEFNDRVKTLLKILEPLRAKKEEWKLYLIDQQINTIVNDLKKVSVLTKSLNTDFEDLCAFDNLKDGLESYESKVIEKLYDEIPEISDNNIVQIFKNSLALSWIEHIETKYPILRTVSAMQFREMEHELQEAVKEKLKVSNDIMLLRARERTYQNVEYNRLHNMVTYRDLNHQVTKKRRIWPLRKLIANFYNELFDLVPCWMASPESVSALFPMESFFDIVIFDEASQTFVERGIPAMYRGKQVVVAGDNKQLRPNDLYKIRWEDEEEDTPALEIDSLLELVERHLMNVQLRGHYRSKSLDLIDFSNTNFYDGNLTLLPDFEVVNSGEPAIHYVKVDGVWDKNINDAEAKKVTGIILKILKAKPEKEIGVVTFNARQQNHILDVLEEEAIRKKVLLPDTLFIKNIENVQGDEKDIIIFSTAYGPDLKGKLIMQFGSLNQSGGENRLNVAVTRAREEIYVISSIWPDQLKVDESLNQGPKLLKKYLKYAVDVDSGNFKPTIPRRNGNPSEWYLKSKLNTWARENAIDCLFEEELPFADITIKKSSKYLGLLLTDDDIYYSSVSVKEMHVYKPFTLSSKRWKFKGFFSREYWLNRQKIEEEITKFIHKQSESLVR